MTTTVHCKKEKYDIYIGRPSKWGNPFEIGRDGTREEVIAKYRAWVVTQPNLMKALPELKEKALGCWCKPRACHGDVLVELLGVDDLFRPMVEKAQDNDPGSKPNRAIY